MPIKNEDPTTYEVIKPDPPGTIDTAEDAIIKQAISILEHRIQQPGIRLLNSNALRDYLKLELAGQEYESFCLLLVDVKHRVIRPLLRLFRGTLNQAPVYAREVLKTVLHYNAHAVFLVHNHPSGGTAHSKEDVQVTKKLQAALKLIDVQVLDHFIVGGSAPCSSLKELALI